MKPYIYAYILSAIWFLLVILYLPHSKGYEMIASKNWSFVVMDLLLIAPVLIFLAIAERFCRTAKKSDSQQKSSGP